jgi:copper chaperone CopZ
MKRTFSVPRIHCGGCVQTVTDTLRSVAGVTAAEGDAMKKTVDVVFDPAQVSEQRLRQALAGVGYPAAP